MLLATFCEGVPCIVCVCLNAYLSKLCNVYVRVCRVYGPCVWAVCAGRVNDATFYPCSGRCRPPAHIQCCVNIFLIKKRKLKQTEHCFYKGQAGCDGFVVMRLSCSDPHHHCHCQCHRIPWV
jgi:hypothetical protein